MSTSAYKTRGRGEKAEINLKQLLRWSKKFGSLSPPKFATWYRGQGRGGGEGEVEEVEAIIILL